MMLAVGMDLSIQDFRRVCQAPKAFFVGVIGQLLLVPALAVGLVQLFTVSTHTMTGMLLLAACPAGGISNYYSYLAKANTALSISMTVVSCLAAVISMPIILQFYEWVLVQPFGFELPVGILFGQMLVLVGLPVLTGMAVRHYYAAFVARHKLRLRRLSMLMIALLVLCVIFQEAEQFGAELLNTAPLVFLMIGLAALAGYLAGMLFGLELKDRVTLAIEFPVRNIAIAAVIALTFLGQLDHAAFGAAYFTIEVVVILFIIVAYQYVANLRRARLHASRD